jgi:class 3 adenylate cyclase/tetratricopeptide (TPR) repeat protein
MRPERTLCSACGFGSEPGARFCGGCARPLTRLEPGANRPLPAAASLTPAHLAQRILASRGAIEGERKLVTVMFVDVLGSLEMIAGRDPEQAQAILDALLREMISAVHRYEGTVNQVLGDGLMAIFGAPIAHEDHAVRAACAALAIQDAVCTARESAWRSLGVHAAVRIGLNSGLVVIKAIENDLSIDYRAVGATTHLASRMEQIALPGTIRLTRETLRLAEGLVDVEPLGRIAVKGIAQPVDVYELKRMTPGGTRFRARVIRGLTPLFGRAEEMELLIGALRDSGQGMARAVALHGEPGVGKSRLCYEVTRTESAQAFRVLEAAAVSYGRGTPYSAIVTLLGQYFGIADTESAEELRRRLQQGVAGLAPAPAEHLAILSGLLDVPGENSLWLSLDPVQRKQRVFEAVRAIIRDLCEKQPVILIWEDLHWFDAESLEFVDGLLHDPPSRALLMLLTGREELPGWKQAGASRSEILPLPPALTDAMLRSLVGDAPELGALRARLTKRTYGNPFFVEETVRSLVESGVLVGSPGRYELREPNPEIDIPPTAAALIAARIDGLAPAVKALVQTAAVIGTEMSVDLLRRASQLEEADLRERLAAARETGIMFEIQLFPSPVCGFRHALTQEVAYGSVLYAQRKSLHGRVVEVFEEVHRDRLAEHVERLAEHSFRAELWDKCVRYHIMAAARAASRFANHEAVRNLDRGLRVVEHLAPGRARSEAAIDLRLAGLAALLPLGEQDRILSTLFEAEAIAASIGDPRRLAAVHSQISYALWLTGQHERARESAERALEIAKEQNLFGLELSARFGLIQAHHALGDLERCCELALDVIAKISGDLEHKRFGWAAYPSVLCRTFLGSALTLTGSFEEALRHLERGVALADATRHPLSRALIRHELGTCHLMQGNPEQALRTFEAAMEIARQGEVRTMVAPLAGWLGATLAELGRVDEAIEIIEEVIGTRTARLAGHYAHYFMLNGLASAYARAGRLGEALSRAEEAVDRTLATQEFVHHGHALLRLAAVQAERGAAFFAESESLYRRALERAHMHRMRPLAAESHEGLGRLNVLRGDRPAAQSELRTAVKLYAEVGLAQRAKAAQESADRLGV